jgi:hypothetical protein
MPPNYRCRVQVQSQGADGKKLGEKGAESYATQQGYPIHARRNRPYVRLASLTSLAVQCAMLAAAARSRGKHQPFR